MQRSIVKILPLVCCCVEKKHEKVFLSFLYDLTILDHLFYGESSFLDYAFSGLTRY